MLDDLTKEIKAQLYDRVRSPLFGAFALSWVAWNYRVLLALLTLPEFDKKLAFIDKEYPGAWDVVLHGALGPLLSAVLFLGLYPYPARWAYTYWANQQKKLKVVQQKIEDEMPMTNEEAKTLRKASLEQEAALQGQLKEMADSNKELRERLKAQQEENLNLTQAAALTKASMKKDADLQKQQKEMADNYKVLEENLKALHEENLRLSSELDQFLEAEKKAKEQLKPALAELLAGHAPTVAKDLRQELEGAGKVSSTAELLGVLDNERVKNGLAQYALNPLSQQVFLALIALEGEGTAEDIARKLASNKVNAKYGLDQLRSKALVRSIGGRWLLTPDGRNAAVRLGLTGV